MKSGTSEWTEVMSRLDKLENQNRRFKQIGALALVLVGSVLLMGQAPALKTVEANEFILRDSSGKKRASLGMMLAGPDLTLHDDSGKATASLVASPFGGALSLYGANRNAVNLMPFNGGATLGLTDENGFETRVGTTDLVNPRTGETRWTSAAQ